MAGDEIKRSLVNPTLHSDAKGSSFLLMVAFGTVVQNVIGDPALIKNIGMPKSPPIANEIDM